MTDATPHRATLDQWDNAAIWAADGLASYSCILELRSRLEALEAGATCPHIVSSDEGTSYCGLAEQMAAASSPDHVRDATEMVSAGSLVERVGRAISLDAWDGTAEARAAIREVAAWMRENECDYNAVRWLEQEAER